MIRGVYGMHVGYIVCEYQPEICLANPGHGLIPTQLQHHSTGSPHIPTDIPTHSRALTCWICISVVVTPSHDHYCHRHLYWHPPSFTHPPCIAHHASIAAGTDGIPGERPPRRTVSRQAAGSRQQAASSKQQASECPDKQASASVRRLAIEQLTVSCPL